jgi:uncharacterized membrane protein
MTTFFLALSLVLFSVGEWASKQYTTAPGWFWMVWVGSCYAGSGLLWLPALCRVNHLAQLGSIWAVCAYVLTIMIGLFVFEERLPVCHAIGVALGALAVVLMTL